MDTKDKIKVMQAYLCGKDIQYRKDGSEWQNFITTCTEPPSWSWGYVEYRIKPKMKKVYVVRDHKGNYRVEETSIDVVPGAHLAGYGETLIGVIETEIPDE